MNATVPAAAATPPSGDPPAARAPDITGSWTALATWGAEQLGGRLDASPGRYRLVPAPAQLVDGASPSESAVRRGWFGRRIATGEAPDFEPLEASTPLELIDRLIERLVARAEPPDGHPVEQPEAVHDLSARLFAAYTLDGGQAHLAGFHLEDVPLVRLTSVGESDDGAPLVTHRYYDEVGAPIDRGLAASLGLERVTSFAERSPRLDEARRERMLSSARHADGAGPTGAGASPLATIVWAKRANGCLRFEFGDESLDTPFEGWARTLQAPPAACPQTGVKTFHLATVEGGGIAAADQIEVCSLSGRRRVRGDLAACSETGRLAEPERLAECPVTGDRVLPQRLTPCRLCNQPVSLAASPEGVCRACRSKQRTSVADPRLAVLMERRPGLRRWGRWRVAETRDVVIAESVRGVRCVQWVFSKDGYELIHAVSTLRFASTWRPLSREQRERLLQR